MNETQADRQTDTRTGRQTAWKQVAAARVIVGADSMMMRSVSICARAFSPIAFASAGEPAARKRKRQRQRGSPVLFVSAGRRTTSSSLASLRPQTALKWARKEPAHEQRRPFSLLLLQAIAVCTIPATGCPIGAHWPGTDRPRPRLVQVHDFRLPSQSCARRRRPGLVFERARAVPVFGRPSVAAERVRLCATHSRDRVIHENHKLLSAVDTGKLSSRSRAQVRCKAN